MATFVHSLNGAIIEHPHIRHIHLTPRGNYMFLSKLVNCLKDHLQTQWTAYCWQCHCFWIWPLGHILLGLIIAQAVMANVEFLIFIYNLFKISINSIYICTPFVFVTDWMLYFTIKSDCQLKGQTNHTLQIKHKALMFNIVTDKKLSSPFLCGPDYFNFVLEDN